MKKLLLTLCIGSFVTLFALANNADLFSYDADEVNQELGQLQNLEDYVSANPGITLTNLQSENNGLIANLNLDLNNISGFSMLAEPPLGIPSFLWGCIIGPVGIVLVYVLTDQDGEQTKKALYGCLVGYVGGALLYILFWVVLFGNAFWYY